MLVKCNRVPAPVMPAPMRVSRSCVLRSLAELDAQDRVLLVQKLLEPASAMDAVPRARTRLLSVCSQGHGSSRSDRLQA